MIRKPQKIKMIKISDVIPNPYQVRRKFDRKALHLLCESIKQVGILSPIIVRTCASGYEIICGQRRVRAAQMANLSEIPAIILHAGDLQCALLSMIENIHRENLGAYEEAEGYFNLISYHRIKKDKLLNALSVESNHVNEKIRLLSLSEEVRYKAEESKIEESKTRELLKLHNEEKQLEIINKIKENELNLSEVSALVKQTLREMSLSERDSRRRKIKRAENIPLYINTVRKTAQLLRNNGASVEITQSDSENYVEFTLKIAK